jgi:hypothetical protein
VAADVDVLAAVFFTVAFFAVAFFAVAFFAVAFFAGGMGLLRVGTVGRRPIVPRRAPAIRRH